MDFAEMNKANFVLLAVLAVSLLLLGCTSDSPKMNEKKFIPTDLFNQNEKTVNSNEASNSLIDESNLQNQWGQSADGSSSPDPNSNNEYSNSPSPLTQEKGFWEIENPSFSGCMGTKVVFDYPPVNLEKTMLLVPLGLMTGNHVTPVDHQYFQNFKNTKPDIEVYSPGDGTITQIQKMSGFFYDSSAGKNVEWSDYRLEIRHTCTISSIFIHVTTLSDKIMEFAPKENGYTSPKVAVKAGEIIGHYEKNVDYNLVDTDFTLTGFVIPEHYSREPWKIHIPDTLKYFSPKIQEKMREISLRSEEPISGKFDHDIDGTLQGNWFLEGTNGYAGKNVENYWVGHLSISPDYLDYSHFIISMGDFGGKEAQFGAIGNKPKPSEVTLASGLIRYEFTQYDYFDSQGNIFKWNSLAKGLKAKNQDISQGAILLQLISDRQLKVEIFTKDKIANSFAFSENAKLYER